MSLQVSAIIFQLFKVVMFQRDGSNYPGIKLERALGTNEDKIEHFLLSYALVVHTTAKQVISRRRKNENVFKMSKDEKCTCKACKNTVFIAKYANLRDFCCRCRRGCLNFLLLVIDGRDLLNKNKREV